MQQRNYESLTSQVTSRDVDDLKSLYAQKKSQIVKQSIILLIVFSTLSPALILTTQIDVSSLVYILGWVGLASIIAVIFGILIINQQTKKWQQAVRLNRFAQANGLKFTPTITNPVRDGMIFNIGRSRSANNILTSTSFNPFEIANYTYITGSGKNSRTYNYGYIMVQLDRNLPHMVLDSKANNTNIFGISFSDLPVNFDKDQKLSLEGDFDSHFTLYAPKDYEQDALYIFTPDLMQLFIDDSLNFDAEIIDNKLYIYSNKQFDLNDQVLFQRLFNVIDKVAAKVESQTDRYVDDRVGSALNNVVAQPGRRLKISQPWVIIIVVAFYAIYFAYTFLYPFLSIK